MSSLPFALLPLIFYLIGTLILSFVAGFGFRKGWDLAAPKDRR